MLTFFLEKLSLSEGDHAFLNLNKRLEKPNGKIISIQTRLNNIDFLQNKIENLQQIIENEQYIIFQFETLRGRENQIKKKYPALIARLIIFTEFIIHRAIPRLPIIGFIYRGFTKNRVKILSKAEGLGRIVYSGFNLIEVENFNGLCTVLAAKNTLSINRRKASFGLIFKMNRIGKNGKIIGVYKVRTMHPYSEFIHEYILKVNGYGEKGKPKNDFRVTSWGRFLRKYWLDEIPQLLNILKLEMKLVGLRPVSEVYFNELKEEQKKRRLMVKPGCIPPYVAFNMTSSKENVLKAEELYLAMKDNNPYTTDIKLFFMAIKNIIFLKKRGS
jgi:lipopolysaccharide/colanic/teichoic acid biosynthesis glycosyltransferase